MIATAKLCECGCGKEISGRTRFAHGHYLGNGREPRQEFTPRNCGCGCGRPAPIATKTRRGYRMGEPMQFVHGHFSRTAEASPPPVRRGEDNGRWKGDAISYVDLHGYLLKNFPKAGVCEECGKHGPTDHANIHGRGYTRNREDYREICKSCHSRYDQDWADRQRDAQGRWVS